VVPFQQNVKMSSDCAKIDTVRLRWGWKSSWGVCLIVESQITCDNINGNTTFSKAQGVSLRITFGVRRNRLEQGIAHKLVIMEVFYDLRGDYRVVYHDLCLGGPTTKGVGLCMASSYTGNHREDDFTPLETIRRFLDFVVPSNCLELLSKDNRWDKKSFGDKLPDNIHKNLFFQRLEMLFKNIMYAENDNDLSFLPKEPSADFADGSLSISINTYPLVVEAIPIDQPPKNMVDSKHSSHREEYVIHPRSVATRIRERKFRSRGGSLKPHVKRKVVYGVYTLRSTRAMVVASKDDSTFLTISDDDEGLSICFELENANACHLIIVDNTVNRRSRELPKVIDQIRAECDVLKDREDARDQECEELKAKCKRTMVDLDKNPAVNSHKWAGYRVSLSTLESKVASLEAEKVKLESIEALLYQDLHNANDDIGKLVAKLVYASILYGWCQAFEEVAKIKEPFDITKVKGYRSSYKKEHMRAGNELATVTFSFLVEFVADPHASIEALISKKPRVLQRLDLTRTHILASFAQS
ncbi:hypothetical protein Tco_0630970, partial [Tanacetum coccineum]